MKAEQIGNSVIFNGDCLEVMEQLIKCGTKVDAIITDPPYELEFHLGGQQKRAKDFTKLGKNIDFTAKGFDYEKCFEKMLEMCKIPNILIFCSNKQISKFMSYFENKGLSTTLLAWKKQNACPLGKGKHISDLEYIVYVRGKNPPFNNNLDYTKKYKLQTYPFVNGNKRLPPTQKPLQLIENYVELHSFEEQTILDPFMGSGTTGVACKNTNRKFIGIELDEKYFDIAKQRIEDCSKQKEEANAN